MWGKRQEFASSLWTAKDIYPTLRAGRVVTLLRGRREGLEVSFAGLQLEEAFQELEARLAERPSFYRGACARANFGAIVPGASDVTRLRRLLDDAGISLRALSGWSDGLAETAREHGLEFEPPSRREEFERRRAMHPRGEATLSESARSLVADFDGARNDIAARRRRGEASVPRPRVEPETERATAPLHAVDAPPATLYHAASMRGGQILHHTGNIVVVGDVNPGAELVATGDILVFGRLAGIAHAGAGGDEAARIYALDLAATQLRISTFIAAQETARRRDSCEPEVAVAREGRIVILPLDRLSELERVGVSPA